MTEQQEVRKVAVADAVAMFKGIGAYTANKWDVAKLTERLNSLPDMIKDIKDLPPEIMEDMDKDKPTLLVNVLCRAIAGGEKIELDGDIPMAKSKGKKNTTAKGGARPTVAKKAPASNVDALGSRIGSIHAAINKMLGKKPITMKAIVAKVGKTHYNHMNKLIEDGKVKKVEDGYVLTGK